MEPIFQLGSGSPDGLETLPALQADVGRLYLLIASPPAVDRLMDALAVRLALAGEDQTSQVGRLRPLETGEIPPRIDPYLYLLDGGNRFDLHAIARGLAASPRFGNLREAPGSEYVEAILQRLQVARAFTCYQVEALLAAAAGNPGAAPRSTPVLAPRLLTTFADGLLSDGDAPLPERLRLLERCIAHLKRLARRSPVLVSAVPPSSPQAAGLLARLETAADQVWRPLYPAAPLYSAALLDTAASEAGSRPGASRGAPLQLRLFGALTSVTG
jgi:hypothetical protein